MNKKLSIIIVTFNSEKLIFDCLDSIYKFNDIGSDLEVIIVDNCSDNCDLIFANIRFKYPSDIILINSSVNKGYGHGNNQGIKASNSPILVVMNPDVRLVKPIFKNIIARINNNKNIGLIGVRFIDGSNSLYFKPEKTNLLKLIFGNLFIKYGKYKIQNMFFSGSFLIFDKLSFTEAGCFDENIFMFYEEADISNRILLIGKETILADDIFVEHLAHGRKVNYYLLQVGAKSRKYYFNKYHVDINRYYIINLIYYRLKYFFAILLNNKVKKEEFYQWILMSKKKGII